MKRGMDNLDNEGIIFCTLLAVCETAKCARAQTAQTPPGQESLFCNPAKQQNEYSVPQIEIKLGKAPPAVRTNL